MTQQKLWRGHCERVTDRNTSINFPLYVSFLLNYFAPLWHHHTGNLNVDWRKRWNNELILGCCGTASIKTYSLHLFHKTGDYNFNCSAILASAVLRWRGTAVLKLYRSFCAMLSEQNYKDTPTYGIILQRWSLFKCWGGRSKVYMFTFKQWLPIGI